jgi:hypothetical protein
VRKNRRRSRKEERKRKRRLRRKNYSASINKYKIKQER